MVELANKQASTTVNRVASAITDHHHRLAQSGSPAGGRSESRGSR